MYNKEHKFWDEIQKDKFKQFQDEFITNKDCLEISFSTFLENNIQKQDFEINDNFKLIQVDAHDRSRFWNCDTTKLFLLTLNKTFDPYENVLNLSDFELIYSYLNQLKTEDRIPDNAELEYGVS